MTRDVSMIFRDREGALLIAFEAGEALCILGLVLRMSNGGFLVYASMVLVFYGFTVTGGREGRVTDG